MFQPGDRNKIKKSGYLFYIRKNHQRDFSENASGCDISVMEGVMGYYDGVGGTTTKASAYDLARSTSTPAMS